jgi:hypothetical protein
MDNCPSKKEESCQRHAPSSTSPPRFWRFSRLLQLHTPNPIPPNPSASSFPSRPAAPPTSSAAWWATVSGGNNPTGLTIANAGAYNSAITEAVYTGIGGGVAATNLHHTYVLGANALAIAEGRMRMGDRKEDDYGQFIGRDADNIWGATRMDWLDATGAANNNVSSACFVNTMLF